MIDLFCCYFSFEDPSEAASSQKYRGTDNNALNTQVVTNVVDQQLEHADQLKKYITEIEGYAFKTAADIIQSQHKLIGDLKRELERSASSPSAPTMSTFARTFDNVNRSREEFIMSGNALMTSDRPPQLQQLTQISLSYS